MFETRTILGVVGWGAVFSALIIYAIYFAVSWYVMRGMSPNKPKHYPYPDVGGYPLQTSSQGVPIVKVYGTKEVAGNVMWKGPTIPYQIRIGESGGTRWSNEHRKVYYRIAYKKSFLIGITEGPAGVIRMNKGKLEVPLSEATIFEGVDNSGIRALTGEDFGDWPNMCCAFFFEYELGDGDALPQFTFEVVSGRSGYFVGVHYGGGSDRTIITKYRTDDTIDTTWADNGGWHYLPSLPVGSSGTVACYDFYQMPDGRMLVAHYPFWIEAANLGAGGKIVTCTMLAADGTIDTTWGYNGHYVTAQTGDVYPMVVPTKILRDNDGNFHLFGSANGGNKYNYHIFDEDGTRLYAYNFDAGAGVNRHPITINDAVFNGDKTRIVAVGPYISVAAGPVFINTVAFSVADGTIDTGFTGNVSTPGYAMVSAEGDKAGYAIKRMSDGGYVVWFQEMFSSIIPRTLRKITEDGSGWAQNWGINRTVLHGGWQRAGAGVYKRQGMVQAGDSLFTLGRQLTVGAQDATIQVLNRFDDQGLLVNSVTFDSGTNDVYHVIGRMLDNVVLGTNDLAPANFNIERYSFGGTFIDGYDLAASPSSIKVIAAIGSPYDCNPAYIIRDLRTHDRYGAGQAAALIDDVSFQSCENYWDASGLLISIAVNEQKPIDDWIDEILRHCFGYRFESNGLYKLGAYRNQSTVFEIEQSHFIVEKGREPPPPVKIAKRPHGETFNDIKVMWTDRQNGYSRESAHARDMVDQRIHGVRSRIIELIGIMNPDIAQQAAERWRFESMYRYSHYSFTVGYRHMRIETGDVGLLSDGGKLVNQKIRILTIEDDKDGRQLKMEAIDDIPSLYPDWNDLGFQVQPPLRTDPAAVTLADGTVTFREDIDTGAIYLSIAPGNALANGWEVHISYDDVTYEFADYAPIYGVIGGDANSVGTIQSNLPAHPAVVHRQGESFLVNIGTVTDLETTINDENFFAGRKLAKIGNEIIGYRDCVETATAGVWQVTNLIRGMFGTEAVVHSSGETFATLDIDFPHVFRDIDIGQTLYFKVLAYYGTDIQDIADVSSFSVAVQGYHQRPAAASLLRLTADENDGGSGEYSGTTFTLYWNLGSRVSGFNYGDWLNLPWNNYIADAELQVLVLRFEQTDGTLIGERNIAVANSEAITKATDLGGFAEAVVKVIPRRLLRSRLANSLLVESI